jgi:hypothetical protein
MDYANRLFIIIGTAAVTTGNISLGQASLLCIEE